MKHAHIMSFWSKEHSLSALLALLVIQTFVVAPLTTGHYFVPALSSVLFSLILLAGLLTITKRRITRLLSQLFVATTLGLHWTLFFAPSRALLVTDRYYRSCSITALPFDPLPDQRPEPGSAQKRQDGYPVAGRE